MDLSKGRKSKNVIDRRTTTIAGTKLKQQKAALLKEKQLLKELLNKKTKLTELQSKRKKAIQAKLKRLGTKL